MRPPSLSLGHQLSLTLAFSSNSFAIQFKVWDHLLRPLPALSRTERRARRESRALDAERRVTRHDDELNAWETAHGKGPRDLDGRGWAEKGLDSPSGSNAVLKRTDSGWGSASGSTGALQDGVAVPVLGQKSSASRHAALEADRQELDQKEKLLGEIQVRASSGCSLALKPPSLTRYSHRPFDAALMHCALPRPA